MKIQAFLNEFNRRSGSEATLDDFLAVFTPDGFVRRFLHTVDEGETLAQPALGKFYIMGDCPLLGEGSLVEWTSWDIAQFICLDLN